MKYLFCFFTLFFLNSLTTARVWTPSEIPSLNYDVWVSDPDNYMTMEGFFKLNHLLDSNSYLKSRVSPIGFNDKPYQIAVLIIDEMAPSYSASEFAETVFNRWGLGHKGYDNGILLFVSVNDRELTLTPGAGITSNILSRQKKQLILNTIKPHLKRRNYATGLVAGTSALVNTLPYVMANTYVNTDNDADTNTILSYIGDILLWSCMLYVSCKLFYWFTCILLPVTNGGALNEENRENMSSQSSTHTHHTTHNYYHEQPNYFRWYNPLSWRSKYDSYDDNMYSRRIPRRTVNTSNAHTIHSTPMTPIHKAPSSPVAKNPQGGKTCPNSSTTDTFDSTDSKLFSSKHENRTWKTSFGETKETLDEKSSSIESDNKKQPYQNLRRRGETKEARYVREKEEVEAKKVKESKESIDTKPKGGTTRRNSSTSSKW